MKKNLQIGLILGMIILSGNSFGQLNGMEKPKKVTETYLDLVLNVVGTNLNYGKSNGALADYKKAVLGGQVGVSLQAGITPRVSLVTELYFFMKGGELKVNNPLTTYNTNIRLYTLELPVLARFHFGKFHVNAGPSIAYNLYGSQKIENATSDLVFNNSSENFKRWEAGVQMGGGYRFHTKRKSILLDVRYNYGLTDISNNKEMYNRSLIISLHFSKPWKTNPLGRK
jgi:Outer membrane protein beta-barrel domain